MRRSLQPAAASQSTLRSRTSGDMSLPSSPGKTSAIPRVGQLVLGREPVRPVRAFAIDFGCLGWSWQTWDRLAIVLRTLVLTHALLMTVAVTQVAQAEPPSVPPMPEALGADLPRMKRLWHVRRGRKDLKEVAVANGTVFATIADELVAIDAKTGMRRWSAKLPEGDLEVDVADGRVLVSSGKGTLLARGFEDGQLLWQNHADCECRGLGGAHDIAVGWCLVRRHRLDRVELRGIDLTNGRALWHVPLTTWEATPWRSIGNEPFGPVQVDHERAYVAIHDKPEGKKGGRDPRLVVALAIRTGRRLWQARGYGYHLGLVGDTVVTSGSTTLDVRGLRASDGAEVWTAPHDSSDSPGVAVRDGIVVLTYQHEVRVLSPATGEVLHRWPMPPVPAPTAAWRSMSRTTGPASPPPFFLKVAYASEALIAAEVSTDLFVVWRGDEARVLQPPPRLGNVLAVTGEVLVAQRDFFSTELEAWSLRETDPAESTLPLSGRVREALLRDPEADDTAAMLRIPQHADELRRVASDRSSDLRMSALAYLGAIAEPASVPLLLAVLDEPRPAPSPGELRLPDRPWNTHSAALVALARHDTPAAAARLAALLPAFDDPTQNTRQNPIPVRRSTIARQLARVADGASQKALATLDRKSLPNVGWKAVCSRHAPLPETGRERCSGGKRAGDFEVLLGEDAVLWLRRLVDGEPSGPPAVIMPCHGCLAIRDVKLIGKKLRLHGERTGTCACEAKPFSADIDPAAVFADADGDGIPDRTEVLLGTDPANPDSDGDGVPDGDDPCPLAAAPGAVEGAVVHYAMLNAANSLPLPDILVVQAEHEAWREIRNAATVVIHTTRPPREHYFTDPDGPPRGFDLRFLRVDIDGASATVEVDVADWSRSFWSGFKNHKLLRLKRVGEFWRVVAEESP